MSVSVETEGENNQLDDVDVSELTLEDTGIAQNDDHADGIDEQLRKVDLESRLAGESPDDSIDSQESLTREEKLLEEMLRLKLTGSVGTGASNSLLPPNQRLKLYQPRTKLEQFEDILLESQLLDQNLPDLGGAPLDYEKFDLESISLQEALNGFTDYDSTDAIFADHKGDDMEGDNLDNRDSSSVSGSCECESCYERSALVAEMAEETKKLQSCWLKLREDFKTVYRLVLDEAWSDSNRPHPSLSEMQDAVHKLVWRDPHQLYQRLESQLRDIVTDIKQKLVELLSKQAKNPSLAQDFIQSLLSGHEKLCEASKILSPVLSDLEVNHLRRFSLTWDLLSKHMYQALVYCDPLIQNNLPIFISQLRALYPNKENEDKYTELVRGYLDFDVDMENIGVFWSGAEALILDYSRDQQKLREKQKMLKSDWEKFKAQRKQIENSLREKAETNGGGEELIEDADDEDEDQKIEDKKDCECHACTDTCGNVSEEPLFPPTTNATPVTSSSLYPHLYNIPGFSTSSTGATSSVVSSVASLTAALSSTLSLSTTTVSTTVTSIHSSVTQSNMGLTAATTTALTTNQTSSSSPSTPVRPTSLPVSSASTVQVGAGADNEKEKKDKTKPLDKRPTTCNHKHNNKNAKELKKMMGHDCKKKKEDGPKKSKSSSAIQNSNGDDDESTEEMSDDSDPEDSCSSSSHGNDKQCPCCYCEVFGHGNPSGAPVPSNYPQMRERLRLLLSKKKRSSRAAAAACQQQPNKAVGQQQQQAVQQQTRPQQQQPQPQQMQQQQLQQQKQLQQQQATQQQKQVPQQPPKTVTIKRQTTVPVQQQQQQQLRQPVKQPPTTQDVMAKKDVDEIIDFIEGNGSASEKKRLKKERQKQQKLEVLRAKQEEERRRKAAEEAARKAVEEQERMRKEAEEKALKKSKKKAAQKAKKLAAAGGTPAPATPSSPTTPQAPAVSSSSKAAAMMDLENMQLEHIRQQKELLEKQKKQLEEQQRKLDEELNKKIAEKNAAQAAAIAAEKAKDVANSQLSKKQLKKQAKKAAAAALSNSASSSSINSSNSASAPAGNYSNARYPTSSYAPYPSQPSVPPSYTGNPFQSQPPYSVPQGMYPGMGAPGGMGGPFNQQVGGYPQMGGGFSPFGPPFQPPAPTAAPPKPAAPAAKSDQPMVTIKRVMRPDTDEPTVTISVKKDEGTQKEKEKVLFTLVNGQVLKTPSAPDNLIPSAVPMSKELQKKIIPEEENLSKKQRKKLRAQMAAAETQPHISAPAPSMPPKPVQPNVDLDKLRLPDGVSISKINGPVPERKYFPCKTGPEPGPQVMQSNPWGVPNSQMFGNQMPGAGQYPGTMYPGANGANQQGNDNVIVVDTNNIDEKSSGKNKKKNKKKDVSSASQSVPPPASMVNQPPAQPMWGQPPLPSPGMFQGLRPSFPMASQQPPAPAPVPTPTPAANKPKDWTPAQYGGYVPPADGKGGGQVLIKSVNGKVVITPIPGTGDNPPLSTAGTTPVTPTTTAKKATPAPTVKPAVSQPAAPQPPVKKAPAPVPAPVPAPTPVPVTTNKTLTNGTTPAMNGNSVNSNGDNNNQSGKENDVSVMNGNNDEVSKKINKHKSPELEDLNSIFDPRSMDCGGMDAADREIEQFKLFCRDSVPLQNRTKVSFDVRNIAFKKKM